MRKIGIIIYDFLIKQRKNWILPLVPILFITLYMTIVYNNYRLYGDSAGYLFDIINFRHFFIAHERFIGVVTQIIPVILVYFNISIEKIILFYSINEWIWYLFCFFIIYKYYQQPISAVGMLIMVYIGTRWNWFNPVSELIIASPIVFFLILDIKNKISKTDFWFYFRNCLYIIILIYSHPLYSIILPWLYFLVFIHDFKEFSQKKSLLLLVIYTAIVIIFHFFRLDSYDISSTNVSIHNNIFKILSLKLLLYFIKFFPLLLLLGIYSLIILFKKSKLLLGFIFITSLLMYFLMVIYKFGHYYPSTNEPFERYLYPLVLIVFIFWFVILNKSWNYLVLIFVAYHFYINIAYGSVVSQRYFQLSSVIQNSQQWNEGKIYIRAENYYPVPLGHDWTMCTESILLSSYYLNSTKQLWIQESIDPKVISSLDENNYIYSAWALSMNTLNKNYFQMPKTLAKCANTDSVQSNLPDSFYKNITLQTISPFKLPKNKELLIPVKITNKNPIPIYSGNKIERRYINYQWILHGGIIVDNGYMTPLVMDVISSNVQLIRIKTPEKPGNYKLQLDIVYENVKRAGINNNMSYSIY